MSSVFAGSEKSHIQRTPGVCGGRPCIAGTRIRVQDIYQWHEKQGKSPDEIVSSFPQLQLADVYAALAFFWDHRDEILAQIKEEESLVTQMKSEVPSKVAERLKTMGNRDAVSYQ
ncbi:MAG: DUF433 domain-containing protein [Phycisphaerales bacterium]|nr:DUF433 domain-containing protein [Phycisphaerales bacterium]